MEQFQIDQTALAQTFFGFFPTAIAEENQEMSYLFMGLCFDVLCVFQKAFGPLPSQNDMDIDWIEKQAVLLDAEFTVINIVRLPINDMILNDIISFHILS